MAATRARSAQGASKLPRYGARLAGRLKGATLSPPVLEPEFWLAWSEFHPGARLYLPHQP
ncbi:MAG: hypothetical protein ACRD01_02385 [Terriglobales bacterium]